MESFYSYVGITRQGFSKKEKKYLKEESVIRKLEIEIKKYRKQIDRRAGSRSLYYNLEIKSRYGIGINKFESYVSLAGLSLVPLRVRVVTTQSCYQSWNYDNLCNGLEISGINQLIVGDITYIYLGGKRYYLFCLTDVFSSRIVGHCLSDRMRTIEAQKALKKCIRLRGEENLLGCTHLTDGGKQYFSEKYLETISNIKLKISVAKTCLENAYAEQRNGLIKHHLIPTMKLKSIKTLGKEMSRVIKNYNSKRKQKNLGWLSPENFEEKLKKGDYNPKLRLHDHKKNKPSVRIGF